MTISVRAIGEFGVLRPVELLTVSEGLAVDVIITTTQVAPPPLRAPTPEEED